MPACRGSGRSPWHLGPSLPDEASSAETPVLTGSRRQQTARRGRAARPAGPATVTSPASQGRDGGGRTRLAPAREADVHVGQVLRQHGGLGALGVPQGAVEEALGGGVVLALVARVARRVHGLHPAQECGVQGSHPDLGALLKWTGRPPLCSTCCAGRAGQSRLAGEACVLPIVRSAGRAVPAAARMLHEQTVWVGQQLAQEVMGDWSHTCVPRAGPCCPAAAVPAGQVRSQPTACTRGRPYRGRESL